MATKSTTSTDFVFLETFIATGLPISVTNEGGGKAEIEFREIFDNRETLGPGDCISHIALYLEVWFRSVHGQEVTVTSSWGACSKVKAGTFASDIDDAAAARIRATVLKARTLAQAIQPKADVPT